MVRAAAWPWRSASDPVLDRTRPPLSRVGPARDVAGGEDPGALGLEESSTTMPLSIASPAASASAIAGRTPTPATTRSAASRSPSSSVTAARHRRRWRVLAEVEDDAVLLVERADEVAELAARAPAPAGARPGATTWTSSPRARSDAATSSPMKLAPSTTTRAGPPRPP